MNISNTSSDNLQGFDEQTIQLVKGFPTIREHHIKLLEEYLQIKANMDDSDDALRAKAGAQYVVDTLVNVALLQSQLTQKSDDGFSLTID